MKRLLRNVFTYATCDHRTQLLGDEILSAEPVPKLLVMPMTWRGDLQPVLDAYLEQLRPLENGLTLGRVLHAQEVPALLDLGTAWLGSFRERALASYDEKPGAVDATEVLRQIEAVRWEMGTGDPRMIADALHRLRCAADRVARGRDEKAIPGAFSEGRRTADGLMRRRMIGDFSRPVSIATINERNHDFHARNSATPHLDSSGRLRRTGDARPSTDAARQTALRDAVHAQVRAKTSGDLLRAMNDVARAFWPSASVSPAAPLDRLANPVSRALADINAANRAFWACRS